MLATLDDLSAIGAIPETVLGDTPLARRATRLLEIAQAQVLLYIGETEDTILALDDDNTRLSLIAIIAEVASSRLQYNAAPSTDGYVLPEGLVSSLLQRRHYRALNRMFASGASTSITIERDDNSSFLGAPLTDLWWT